MSPPSSSSSSGMNTPESSTAGNMNVEDLIKLLTLDEKVALTRGTCSYISGTRRFIQHCMLSRQSRIMWCDFLRWVGSVAITIHYFAYLNDVHLVDGQKLSLEVPHRRRARLGCFH